MLNSQYAIKTMPMTLGQRVASGLIVVIFGMIVWGATLGKNTTPDLPPPPTPTALAERLRDTGFACDRLREIATFPTTTAACDHGQEQVVISVWPTEARRKHYAPIERTGRYVGDGQWQMEGSPATVRAIEAAIGGQVR